MIGIVGMDLVNLMGFAYNPVSEKCSHMNHVNVSPISFLFLFPFFNGCCDRHLYLSLKFETLGTIAILVFTTPHVCTHFNIYVRAVVQCNYALIVCADEHNIEVSSVGSFRIMYDSLKVGFFVGFYLGRTSSM